MSGKADKKALVLGVGNILMGDEGLGVRAVGYFESSYCLPPEVKCLDGGTAGVNLLSVLKDYTHLIVIDAIASQDPPGTIRRFGPQELDKLPPTRSSAHFLGVKDLLALAEFEGYGLRPVVIGVVPKDLSPGLGLSELIKNELPHIAVAIADELDGFGFKVERRSKHA